MDVRKIKVLMLGDSLTKQGGIVTVEKLMLEQAPPEIQIHHIGTVVDGSSVQKILVFAIALCQFILKLISTEVDIVHIHVAERGSAFRKAIITFIAKSVFRKPVILHSHSPEFRLFYQKLPEWIKHWLLLIFSKCDRFIALSESWKNFYINDFGLKTEQVLVLANPIKLPEQIPLRVHSKQVCFVCLGRIGQRKGTFDLIKAFAMLPNYARTQASLILAGDGEIEKASKLVENMNIVDCVSIVGWVDSEQRDALLAKADVFVLASYNEGLPLALLEAMGWSLPAIATPVGGIPDIIAQNQNGLLVNPGDIKQLSKAMLSLIQNENLRLSLGSHARVSVTPLDVKNYFNNLVYIYHSVLSFQEYGYVKISK